MDILNFICISILFLPFLFGVYLLCSRVALVSVNKNVLKWGNICINSLCLVSSLLLLFSVIFNGEIVSYSTDFFLINNINFNFGIFVDIETTIPLLIYSAITYLLISLFAKFYFDKKKQFLFTKQRYYTFLSFLAFNTYLFIISSNLFQSYILWMLQGVIIFLFSYFDLFKNAVNYNITRFTRITIIGDFALLLGSLMLYKYAVLSQDYIELASCNYEFLDELVKYISDKLGFYLVIICFIVACISKLFIFPFSCYYSFFANSSNIFYTSILTASNTVLGLFLFLKTKPYLDYLQVESEYIGIAFILFGLISLMFIIFEKNIKIIFGYLVSALNSFLLGIYMFYPNNLVIFAFYILNIILLLILMRLFILDINSLKSALINRNKGFLLEKTHILIFEKLPLYIFKITDFIDEKIFQNIMPLFVRILSLLSSLLVVKVGKQSKLAKIRTIFILFALFAIVTIFITYFGRYNAEFLK